jgi:serine O-acetyltransferase
MKDKLIQYLNKFLSLYYLDYPKDKVERLYEFFNLAKDTLILDIKAKAKKSSINYLQFSSDKEIESQLFSIIQLDTTIEAVFYYRLERAIFLKDPDHPLLPFLANLMKMKTGVDLYYSSEIGPGFNIQHGFDIVVGPRNKIGSNFIIHQGVTIGQGDVGSKEDFATIGDNVVIFSGAKIVGKVRVGNNVKIAANAVLVSDADSDSIYAGIPAKKIKSIAKDIKL